MSALADWRGHRFLALPVRIYLAAIFLLACWHKILDPQSFAVDVATYQILPLWLVNLMAIILPWVELVAALLLATGVRVRAAALLVSGMMVVFLIAISLALAKGLQMSCGCFASQGATEDPIGTRTVLRDAAWLLLAVYVLAFDRSPIGLASLRRPASG
jgi:uncharacterized membrane protein YphA (DoxX/SURF4 family)